MYKLHRPEAPNRGEAATVQEVDEAGDRISIDGVEGSEVRKNGWKEEQGRKLAEVLRSRNQSGGDVGA